MIRHVHSRREDTVSDAVGCMRAFGSLFLVSGIGALSVAVFGLAGMSAESWVARGLVGLIGASHVFGGLVAGWGAHVTSVVSRAGVERTERRPLRAPVRRRVRPSEVEDVQIVTEQDSDGDDQFVIALCLESGERLNLTRHPTQSRTTADEIAEAVSARLGPPIVSLASGDTFSRQRPRLGAPQQSGPLAASRRPSRASPRR